MPRGGSASQIYGTINANNSGNIYVVNPNGVQIGKSAQINVGSLYVSNKDLVKNKLSSFNGDNISLLVDTTKQSNAQLMSLGNINANKVTFEGDRVVIDFDRVKTLDENNKPQQIAAKDLIVNTTDKSNVVIGYSGYDDENNTYAGKNNTTAIATVNNADYTKKDGYMWVKNLEQLQAMNTNPDGNYALNNSIDAIPTKDWNSGTGFKSIGNDDPTGKGFQGKFDGLNNEIFGLTVNRGNENNAGLFGKTDDATIKNTILINGSIKGNEKVGAFVGSANNTKIENVVNSAHVSGSKNVGGIAGSVTGNSTITDAGNTSTVMGNSNVGGIAGSLVGKDADKATINGSSYNFGAVYGTDDKGNIETATDLTDIKDNKSTNIGGVVGYAENAVLGSDDECIRNDLTVKGGYNVGGIVGSMTGTTVKNADNSGNITAVGYTNGMYEYHGIDSANFTEAKKQENLAISNVGGIVGNAESGAIDEANNTGNVKSVTISDTDETYVSGNIGGIAGSAVDTNISHSENKENEVRGAHNIGGIAGYVEGNSTISDSINNGGDILGTGARNSDNTASVLELVTDSRDGYIGNIGGIVGYMYGDTAYIKDASNRGYIHTGADLDKESSKAGNIGGIVGKIDRTQTASIDDIKNEKVQAAVKDSYNTGRMDGYIAVGGIAGMMYNGEITGSYNVGSIGTTRDAVKYTGTVNLGGIVGDTTEKTNAKVLLYDVYNKGNIGDKDFTYGARHVGGIVGRLSGDIEKAYNNGNIYNNMTANGGIAGWWTNGSITNSFNTGNITVKSTDRATSQVGGIVGAVGTYKDKDTFNLQNVYNLGTIRSFGNNEAGGIVGSLNKQGSEQGWPTLNIDKVYTTGELYANSANGIKSIIGNNHGYTSNITNAYYIKPANDKFKDLSSDQATTIEYEDRHEASKYGNLFTGDAADDTDKSNTKGDWRIYDGFTTPILNAFLPTLASNPDAIKDDKGNSIANTNPNDIQFGNAYNPYLTMISGNHNIVISDYPQGVDKANISNVDGIAVFGGSLTVNDAKNTGKTMYNGILYADGDLTMTGTDIKLGSASILQGSTVTINSTNTDEDDNALKVNGTIIATGLNSKTSDVTINADGDVEILGSIESQQHKAGDTIDVDGINKSGNSKNFTDKTDITDPTKIMPEVSTSYRYTSGAAKNDVAGSVNITAAKDDNGNSGDVNVLYGNLGNGYINSSNDVNITADGKIYSDADLTVDNGNIKLDSKGESVLDISNIGKHKSEADGKEQKAHLNKFLTHFNGKAENGGSIDFTNKTDSMIAVDMWDKDNKKFNLNKFDVSQGSFNTNITALNKKTEVKAHIWVADADQLTGIQKYKKDNPNSGILTFSFAMKNNIDASQVQSYESIGKGSSFTGTFDGRGNSIIGAISSPEPLFDTIGNGGTVKDLSLVSANVNDAGSGHAIIANTNNGTIDGVTTFGNDISSKNTDQIDAVGGIVGTNNGTISNSKSMNIIRHSAKDGNIGTAYLGGIAGVNNGTIINSDANSAVTSDVSLVGSSAIGGVAGQNNKDITNVVSRGVTTGLYERQDGRYKTAGNVGGIAGINNSSITNAYNESITSGMNNVGGIVGNNSGKVENIANASWVYGGDNVGGIAGTNSSSLTNGRNSAEIIGGKNIKADDNKTTSGGTNVGGLVGVSEAGSTMVDLTNDESGKIKGYKNVGGLVGSNQGTLTGSDLGSLRNRADVIGVQNVGGTAGSNNGTITNVNNDVEASLKFNKDYGDKQEGDSFGGVAGINEKGGTISNVSNNIAVKPEGNINKTGGVIGTNEGTVSGYLYNGADVTGKDNVGGIIGENNGTVAESTLLINGAMLDKSTNKAVLSENTVTGKNGVGGVIGINNKDISKANVVNTTTGTVTGETNVGGIIGTNNASVTGDRDTYGNYYKYHVINNGKVEGTTNVGGLVGENAKTADKIGSLTAAYNTGSVTGKNNVGGVAGSNSSSIDQVFSNTDSVSSTNDGIVGGIVGDNSNGTLTNAYSIGTNLKAAGKGTAGTNTFSWENEDEAKNVTVNGDSSVWKNQTGLAAPMLKVFLTKLVYHQKDGAVADFPYDGDAHGFTVKLNEDKNIVEVYKQGADGEEPEMIGYLAAADGDGVHSLKDYFATVTNIDAGELVPSDTDLIGGNSKTDIGKYDMFFSHQINKDNKNNKDNPNNLGYEFVQGESYPDDPNDPKNPENNNFDPKKNEDPKNPGSNTPKFEITGNPEWEEDIDHWNYLHDDDPWSKKRNFRERKAEFNYRDGGTKVDEDTAADASNGSDGDESKG